MRPHINAEIPTLTRLAYVRQRLQSHLRPHRATSHCHSVLPLTSSSMPHRRRVEHN